MDFNLSSRRLNAPKNITLTYPKDIKKLILTQDRVSNPEYDRFDIMKQITNIYYNIYRSQSINGIYIKIKSKEYPLKIIKNFNYDRRKGFIKQLKEQSKSFERFSIKTNL